METKEKNLSVSIVIPAFNEELAVGETLSSLKKILSEKASFFYEIIVIDDGSSDRTAEIVSKTDGVRLVQNERNRGYGAAIKIGVRAAKFDYIGLIDADGQHNPEDLLRLAEEALNYDMVIGERQKQSHRSLRRKPGLKILYLLANYLAGYKIPDLNSGLRIINRQSFLRYESLYSDSFSLSTTSTLAFLKGGLRIKYVPIVTKKRLGKSSVKQGLHGLTTILLILRVIMVFNPMKIFVPISAILFSFGVVFSLYGIIIFHSMPNSGVLIILTSIILFFNGLIADQISAIRRDR